MVLRLEFDYIGLETQFESSNTCGRFEKKGENIRLLYFYVISKKLASLMHDFKDILMMKWGVL